VNPRLALRDLYGKLKLYGPAKAGRYALIRGWRKLAYELLRGSYSQYGEDLIIDDLLGRKNSGFYVDIGAYDPHTFSNTKRFYKRGWTGINIEPSPAGYRRFVANRSRDTNINEGVCGEDGYKRYYEFFPAFLSTFSAERASQCLCDGYSLTGTQVLPVRRLAAILERHAEEKRRIDFFSIDTEGLELQILQSNDWARFRPTLICLEVGEHGAEAELDEYLDSVGYSNAAETCLNKIYRDLR